MNDFGPSCTILRWGDQRIGLSSLRKKFQDKFNVVIPYHGVFDGKGMALRPIQGNWNDSFQMLYTFKVEFKRRHHQGVLLT